MFAKFTLSTVLCLIGVSFPVAKSFSCGSVTVSECNATVIRAAYTTAGCTELDAVTDDQFDSACAATVTEFVETEHFYQPNKNYMDGGGDLNHQSDSVNLMRETGMGGRMERFTEERAKKRVVAWPEYLAISGTGDDADNVVNNGEGYAQPGYMSNFNLVSGEYADGCDLRTVMCCFIADREGLEETDAALLKNADVCYHDLENSRRSNHVKHGYAAYTGTETDTYCHAFAWEEGENVSNRFKGNTLFAASYMTTIEKGYVRQIPGAPMCACIEKMPTVSDAACLDVTADTTNEQYVVTYDDNNEEFVAEVSGIEVSFNNCTGASFLDHYSTMSTSEEQTAIGEKILGATSCGDSVSDFLNDKFWVPGTRSTHDCRIDGSDGAKMVGIVGERSLYTPMPGEDAFAAQYQKSVTHIMYRCCPYCTGSHKHIYYRRFNRDGNERAFHPDMEETLNLFMNYWTDQPGNENLVDFALYPTYEAALAEDEGAQWQFCNYNGTVSGFPAIGFPRDCGLTGAVGNQWNSYDPRAQGGSANHHKFYIDMSGV